MGKVLEKPSFEGSQKQLNDKTFPRTYALMGLTNHTSTWAANFHKEFPKKPNKKLTNLINQSYNKLTTFKEFGNRKAGRSGRGLVF